MNKQLEETTADVIGGFPYAEPTCRGCGKELLGENAWMTDGCPCNTPLGVNSMNETRWRLLMRLQQKQATALQHSLEREEKLVETLTKIGVAVKPYRFFGAKPTWNVCDEIGIAVVAALTPLQEEGR